MAYMIAGYMIIWVASFVFIFSMVRRQASIERELAALKDAVGEKRERK